VAGFIGSPPMNLMSASIVESNGGVIIDEGEFRIQPETAMIESLRPYVGKEVLFGIRPEDLVYDEQPASRNNISARVEVVEPLGAEIHVYASTAHNRIIVRVPPRHDFHVGEEVNLHPDVSKLHVFDQDTEAAVAQPSGVRA
jgi:multiple sugar transport system ATP-binding protein